MDDDGAEPFTVCPVISRSGRDIPQVGIMDYDLVGRKFEQSKRKILV